MREKISVKKISPRCEKFWAKKIAPRAKNFEQKQSHLAQKILSKQNLEKNLEFGGVAISFLRFSPQFQNLNYSAAPFVWRNINFLLTQKDPVKGSVTPHKRWDKKNEKHTAEQKQVKIRSKEKKKNIIHFEIQKKHFSKTKK
jgi:hypothetical protein